MRGRHAKKKNYKKYQYTVTTGAMASGLAFPVLMPPSAQADQLDAADVTAVAQEGCPELDSAELDLAVKVAYAESGFDTDINAVGSEDSRGLWQINAGVHGSPWGDLYDPVTNARAMCDLSSGGADWSPWTAYTSGAYLGSPGAASGGVAPGATSVPTPGSTGGSTYVVQPGDTLAAIARTELADRSRWGRIYRANRETIGSDPDLIQPGQELDLPSVSRTDFSDSNSSDTNTAGAFSAPVEGPVSQSYGNANSIYALGYHTGTDFAAPAGAETFAVSDGVVVASDTSSAYGINVQIQHTDGHYSLYAHLSANTVSEGQAVSAGDLVGYVGNTGTSTGPHLHLEIRSTPTFGDGNFLDPEAYLRDNGVVI